MPAPIHVTGNLKDLFNVGVDNGTITFQLVGFGISLPRINATTLLASVAPNPKSPAATTGAFDFLIWGNDQISPAGTYYMVTVQDDNGNVIQSAPYQFNGAGPIDLNSVAPYVVPGSGYVAPVGSPIVRPATLFEAGVLRHTGTVTTDELFGCSLAPGQPFTAMKFEIERLILAAQGVPGTTLAVQWTDQNGANHSVPVGGYVFNNAANFPLSVSIWILRTNLTSHTIYIDISVTNGGGNVLESITMALDNTTDFSFATDLALVITNGTITDSQVLLRPRILLWN